MIEVLQIMRRYLGNEFVAILTQKSSQSISTWISKDYIPEASIDAVIRVAKFLPLLLDLPKFEICTIKKYMIQAGVKTNILSELDDITTILDLLIRYAIKKSDKKIFSHSIVSRVLYDHLIGKGHILLPKIMYQNIKSLTYRKPHMKEQFKNIPTPKSEIYICGAPFSGKSTLVNKIMGKEIFAINHNPFNSGGFEQSKNIYEAQCPTEMIKYSLGCSSSTLIYIHNACGRIKKENILLQKIAPFFKEIIVVYTKMDGVSNVEQFKLFANYEEFTTIYVSRKTPSKKLKELIGI